MERWLRVLFGFSVFILASACVKPPEVPRASIDPDGVHKHRDILPLENDAILSGGDLYQRYCQACHGMLDESSKKGRSFAAIKQAIKDIPDMRGLELNDPMIRAIAEALSSENATVFACDSKDGAMPIAEDTIRPLSKSQYANTLRDLFRTYISLDAIALDVESIPLPQDKKNPFDNVGVFVSQDHFRAYSAIARRLSEQLIANANFINASFGAASCLEGQNLSRQCVQSFAANMGKKIHRRLLTQGDMDTWMGLVSDETNAREEAMLILSSSLLSGDFLFHMTAYGRQVSESDPGLFELSAFELASRLSYALWGTMPDDELFRLAETGDLKEEAVLNQQIDRLLMHPKAREHNARFYSQWLQLKSNLPLNIPEQLLDGLRIDDSLKNDIEQEAMDFVNAITFEQKGNYTDLLTSGENFAQSANYRSILGNGGAEERPGLLWRIILSGSTFTSHRNLIHSGLLLRERLLCETLPQPPPSLAEEVQQAVDQEFSMLSTRDEVAKKTEAPSCAGCHTKINPLAFAGANHYDWIGRYITSERRLLKNGEIASFPVNGKVDDPSIAAMGEQPVDGPAQLAEAIAMSNKGPACLIQKRYAAMMGREVKADAERDGCVLKRSYDAMLVDPEASLLDMLKALLGPELNYRRIESL
ncbi:MAG: DUF1592 domain-containing protein [Oligoflexus sp.]